MRVLLLSIMALPLAACGNAKEKQSEADAKAAGFVPPSVLSRLDYGGTTERRFRTLDRNGDDAISPEELPRQESRLSTLDANGDKRITAEEWSKGMRARFDRVDANRDGSVTADERAAAQDTPLPR